MFTLLWRRAPGLFRLAKLKPPPRTAPPPSAPSASGLRAWLLGALHVSGPHAICLCAVQPSRSAVSDSAAPWIAARQASLSITNPRSSLRLASIESVMPSSHLILSRPLLLLPPIPPSVKVFSNESTLRIRWPKYWSFSFSISPSNEHPRHVPHRSHTKTAAGSINEWMDGWMDGWMKE